MSLFFHLWISLPPSPLLIIPFFYLVFWYSSSVLSWSESYFSGRFQSVSINGTLSTPSFILYGVPHGSVLSPILFVLYTYPIFTIVNIHSLSHQSFSDDSQLYITGPASELSNVVSSTQSCISQQKSWMSVYKLELNEDKIEMILISPQSPFCPCLRLSISIAAQSPYHLLFAVLVSHMTNPSHSVNMLLMSAVCATWRFPAYPLFVTFSLMMPLKPFSMLLFCHV